MSTGQYIELLYIVSISNVSLIESNNTRPYEEIDSGGMSIKTTERNSHSLVFLGLSPSRPALKRRKRGGNSYKRGNPFIALEASEGSDDEDQGGEGEEDGKNDGTSRRNVNDGE